MASSTAHPDVYKLTPTMLNQLDQEFRKVRCQDPDTKSWTLHKQFDLTSYSRFCIEDFLRRADSIANITITDHSQSIKECTIELGTDSYKFVLSNPIPDSTNCPRIGQGVPHQCNDKTKYIFPFFTTENPFPRIRATFSPIKITIDKEGDKLATLELDMIYYSFEEKVRMELNKPTDIMYTITDMYKIMYIHGKEVPEWAKFFAKHCYSKKEIPFLVCRFYGSLMQSTIVTWLF